MAQQKEPNTYGSPNRENLLWDPFPTDALPEPFAEFVSQLSSSLGTDPVFVVYPLLAVLGRSIKLRYGIRISPTRVEYPIFWLATAGDSGEETLAIRETLTLLPPEAVPHVYARMITRRTILNNIASNGNMSLIVVEDLSSSLVARIRRKQKIGDFESNLWRRLWKGQAYGLIRKGSDYIHIPYAAACVCGHIQTAQLLAWLEEDIVSGATGSGIPIGLAARFVFALPPIRHVPWEQLQSQTVDYSTPSAVVKKLFDLGVQKSRESRERRVDPILLPIAPSACDICAEVHDGNVEMAMEENGALRAALIKMRTFFFRVALLIECTQAVLEGREPKEISVSSIRRARAIYGWAVRECHRIYGIAEARLQARKGYPPPSLYPPRRFIRRGDEL